MANFWCVDSEMSKSSVITKILISGVLRYGATPNTSSGLDSNFQSDIHSAVHIYS